MVDPAGWGGTTDRPGPPPNGQPGRGLGRLGRPMGSHLRGGGYSVVHVCSSAVHVCSSAVHVRSSANAPASRVGGSFRSLGQRVGARCASNGETNSGGRNQPRDWQQGRACPENRGALDVVPEVREIFQRPGADAPD